MPALWTLEMVSLGQRLKDISLSVGSGVTAVLGPSGAGKTSLLNLLVGFEHPDSGAASTTIDPGRRRRPLFWVPQGDGLWPHLSVRGHLVEVGGSHADALLKEFDLEHRADARPETLSRGEKARLSVARAIAADAAVLVMDEPLAHVSPTLVNDYWSVLRRHIQRAEAALVFATHSPGTVLAEAEQVICLDAGKVTYTGPVADLYWRPPNAALANSLGETNWFEPVDRLKWLSDGQSVPACIRPEQLHVVADAEAHLVVEATRFRGAVAEVCLRDPVSGDRKRFWHRPTGDYLRPGTRVRLMPKLAANTAEQSVQN